MKTCSCLYFIQRWMMKKLEKKYSVVLISVFTDFTVTTIAFLFPIIFQVSIHFHLYIQGLNSHSLARLSVCWAGLGCGPTKRRPATTLLLHHATQVQKRASYKGILLHL
jgi:hypothetical protein